MADKEMNDSFILFALSRFGNGPTPEDLSALRKRSLTSWVDEQLAAPKSNDETAEDRIRSTKLRIHYAANPENKWPAMDETRSLDYLDKPIEAIWPLLDNATTPRDGAERRRVLDEVTAATYLRAVYSSNQLREVAVQFWHDHFNVNANGDEHIMMAMPAYDRDVIRKHCFGNFREMLEAVASSTAMLYYLSNHSSRAGAANENYARELFELHTLGRDAYLNDQYDRWREVPGALNGQPTGYIDQDVYEAARAFTGWTVEDGANIDGQRKLPATGKFVYVEGWHDGYQKRVLAQDFDPFAAAMKDGRHVLDLVAAHPATAQHMASKLCQRFIGPKVSAAFVTQIASEWQKLAKAPDQIAQIIRMIALSSEFANSEGTKVKRPLTLAVSFLRMTKTDFTPTEGFNYAIINAGQRLFGYPTPTGTPDDNSYFLGTNDMRNRWQLLYGLAQNSWQTGVCDPSQVIPQNSDAAPTAGDYMQSWMNVFGVKPEPAQIAAITGAIGLPPTISLQNLDTKRLASMVAIAAMAPAYQSA
jgi:uncharacterized protein (DUF1800 family)